MRHCRLPPSLLSFLGIVRNMIYCSRHRIVKSGQIRGAEVSVWPSRNLYAISFVLPLLLHRQPRFMRGFLCLFDPRRHVPIHLRTARLVGRILLRLDRLQALSTCRRGGGSTRAGLVWGPVAHRAMKRTALASNVLRAGTLGALAAVLSGRDSTVLFSSAALVPARVQ